MLSNFSLIFRGPPLCGGASFSVSAGKNIFFFFQRCLGNHCKTASFLVIVFRCFCGKFGQRVAWQGVNRFVFWLGHCLRCTRFGILWTTMGNHEICFHESFSSLSCLHFHMDIVVHPEVEETESNIDFQPVNTESRLQTWVPVSYAISLVDSGIIPMFFPCRKLDSFYQPGSAYFVVTTRSLEHMVL